MKFPDFEQSDAGRDICVKLESANEALGKLAEVQRSLRGEFNSVKEKLADAEALAAIGETSDATRLWARVDELEAEIAGVEEKTKSLNRATVILAAREQKARQEYRKQIEPEMREQWKAQAAALVELLARAAEANVALAHAEREIRRHGVNLDGTMVYAGLTPAATYRNCVPFPGAGIVPVFTENTEFSCWLQRAADRHGIQAPSWLESVGASHEAASAGRGMLEGAATHGQAVFDQAVHQPTRRAFAALADRFEVFVSRWA